MNSSDWVAEHVMGFERGYCQGTMGGGNASSDGVCETWFWCDWCGAVFPLSEGKVGLMPCPKYPFPKFTLVDLMRKLGEKGYHIMVRVDPERECHKFTVVVNSARVCDTDSPLKALCGYLYSKRELWRRFEEVLGPWHGPRKPEKKRFVSGEQVLEEYVPSYERYKGPFDDWPAQEGDSSPAFFANIRDAIKLLQKVVNKDEGRL